MNGTLFNNETQKLHKSNQIYGVFKDTFMRISTGGEPFSSVVFFGDQKPNQKKVAFISFLTVLSSLHLPSW